MSISHVSGLRCENKSQRIASLPNEGVEINKRPKIAANKAHSLDRVNLSPEAQRAYQQNKETVSGSEEFKNNFMEALTKFTNYAYHLNGYTGEANGKHAYMALQVLADKSGFKLPENMNHDSSNALNQFMTNWNMKEDASTDEIYSTMVRVFGGDTTFGMEGATPNQSASLNPGEPFTSGSPDVATAPLPVDEPVPNFTSGSPGFETSPSPIDETVPKDEPVPNLGDNTNSNIREALSQLTNELLSKNGLTRSPGGKDFSRVANILLSKLNSDSGMNLADALGVKDGDSISDIYQAMKQTYYQ